MPTLILEFPNGRKKEYLVTGEKVGLGRKPDNAIHIPDSYVSGRHAEFQRTPDGNYELVDLGSHNGTEVNGKRAQRSPLRDGDRISSGVVEGRFRTADPAPSTPPTSALPSAPRTGPQTSADVASGEVQSNPADPPHGADAGSPATPGPETVASPQQLKAVRDELATTRKELDDAKAELGTVKAELDKAEAELDTINTKLDAPEAELEAARKVTEEARAQMERTVAEAKSLQDSVEASRKAQEELAALAAAAKADADQARTDAENYSQGNSSRGATLHLAPPIER